MKIKLLFLLFILTFFITGCSINKLPENIKEKQIKIISNIEKVNENDILIKFFNDKEEVSYYLYKINGNNFIQYLYTFHNSESSFNEFVIKYNDTYYSLEKIDDALVTIIVLQKGTDNDVYKSIENIYLKDKKYEIIK